MTEPELSDTGSLQAALDRAEARTRALFEAIDDGFCIIEFTDGPRGPLSSYVHIEANSGYERHTGIPGIVGKTVFDVAPIDGGDWVELYGAVLATGRPIRFERAFTEAGRHIEVSAVRVEPAGLNQVSVLFRDITDRKRAEAALKDSEAVARENIRRVKLALDAGAIIGTWVWDIPRDVMTVDEAFAMAFGLDPVRGREGLSLSQIVETVHPEDQAGLAAAIRATIERGGAYVHQYRVRRHDGQYYWLEASGGVERAADGTALTFSGVLIDIEGRRAVEAERDRATAELRALNETLESRVAAQTAELMAQEEALRQSQKMEAVGQLTGGIAHDFNNLLAAIQGSLDLMQTRLDQGRAGEIGRYIATAQAAGKRAAALTHRLLAFSRRQTLAPVPTDPAALTLGIEDLIQRTVGPAITLATTADRAVWPVLIDQNQLENALLNLCINARDAMPGGGRIAIAIRNEALDPGRAADLDLPPGDYVEIAVTDTGTGMSDEVRERAFDPFFTTKPIGLGTGLGLSMTYGFVRQSGGQLRIESAPGQGATLRLYLPRAVEGPLPVAVPVAPAPQTALGSRTVLVVDDEALIRMLMVEVVEDLGFTALQAGTGAEALVHLRSAAAIDLLLTDIGLPQGMNGRQLAEAARDLRADLKVIFVTGYDESVVLGGSPPAAGTQLLSKPFDIQELTDRIREMVV